MVANADKVSQVYYGEVNGNSQAMRERVHWICEHAGGQNVLDIGCSQGIVSILLAREGFNVTGIDVEAQAIEYANRELLKEESPVQNRVRFIHSLIENLDAEPGSFDTIIMGEILEHLVQPHKVLDMAKKMLKDDGRLIVTVPFGVLEHHDHKRNFYMASFLQLLAQEYSPAKVDIVRSKICCVAFKKEYRADNELREYLLLGDKQMEQVETSLRNRVANLIKELGNLRANMENKEQGFDVLQKWQEEMADKQQDMWLQALAQLLDMHALIKSLSQLIEQSKQESGAARQGQLMAIADLFKEHGEQFEQQYESFSAGLVRLKLNTAVALHSGVEEILENIDIKFAKIESLLVDASQKGQDDNSCQDSLEALVITRVNMMKELAALKEQIAKMQANVDVSGRVKEEELTRILKIYQIACNQREQTINQLWKRLNVLEQSARYKIGNILVDSIKKPWQAPFNLLRATKLAAKEGVRILKGHGPAIKIKPLPYKLTQIPKDNEVLINAEHNIKQTAEPKPVVSASDSLRMYGYGEPVTLQDLKVACILDTFSFDCFKYECNLVKFGPDNWQQVLELERPHFLFVESTWQGNDGAWQYKIANYNSPQGDELKQLINWCRERNIPTVFWNKEDPVHFDRFVETAKLFDYVFTTDQNCIGQYQKLCGHKRVFALPFAAQPQLHNPIQVFDHHRGSICFAGTYYANRHKQRKLEMEEILDVARKYELEIYDRNHGLQGKGSENIRYPKRFHPHIIGGLPYEQIVKAYKQYKLFINVNSVTDSPTMFSRRVFEILAAGTPVISTYAKGIENLLGKETVTMVNGKQEAEEAIKGLLKDDDARVRLAQRGIRQVLQEHTYAQRLREICARLGIEVGEKTPNVTIFAHTANDQEVEKVMDSVLRQKYEKSNLQLICVVPQQTTFKYKTIKSNCVYEDMDKEEQLKYLQEKVTGDLILHLYPNNYYGPWYIADMVQAMQYSGSDIVTKIAHYQYNVTLAQLSSKFEHAYVDNLNQACLVKKKLLMDNRLGFNQDELIAKGPELHALGARIYSSDRFNYLHIVDGQDVGQDILEIIQV